MLELFRSGFGAVSCSAGRDMRSIRDATRPKTAPGTVTLDEAPRIIFEDDAIRVIWQPGQSDHLVVAFGNLQMLANGTHFFADAPLRALGVSGIGIMAKNAHWFPAAPLRAALPAIRGILTDHDAVIAFGSSMGGYAALKHARLLGATHIIACEPQWSIDPAECDIMPGWKAYFRPEMTGMGIRAGDVTGRAFILHDPWQPRDRWHARRIAAVHADTALIPIYGAGHHATKVVAGTASLAGLIDACIAGDAALMIRHCRNVGRHNPIRRRGILRRAIAAHPSLAVPQIERLGRREIATCFRPYRHLLAQGSTKARQVLAFGPARRVLVYDATRDRIVHRKHPLGIGQIALSAERRNGLLRLYCIADDLRLPVRLDPQGELVLGIEGGRASRFLIEGSPDGKFLLRAGERYLGVDESGRLRLRDRPSRVAPFSLLRLSAKDVVPES